MVRKDETELRVSITGETEIDRQRAQAIMSLRGLGYDVVTRACGLQRQNVASWFGGNEGALSERSKTLVAGVLGYSNGRFHEGRVHVFRIDGRSKASRARGIAALGALAPCLAEAHVTVLEPPHRNFAERVACREAVYALRSPGGVCVLLLYQTRWFQRGPSELGALGLATIPGSRWSGTDRAGSIVRIPAELRGSVLTGNITAREFDDLVTHGAAVKTWSAAVMVLRENDVTPAELIESATALRGWSSVIAEFSQHSITPHLARERLLGGARSPAGERDARAAIGVASERGGH